MKYIIAVLILLTLSGCADKEKLVSSSGTPEALVKCTDEKKVRIAVKLWIAESGYFLVRDKYDFILFRKPEEGLGVSVSNMMSKAVNPANPSKNYYEAECRFTTAGDSTRVTVTLFKSRVDAFGNRESEMVTDMEEIEKFKEEIMLPMKKMVEGECSSK
ncbi:hypothetical protein [Seleniivibrio sp.]|uniref:hypothetical protein n=1 Tax=Seleniivibrio sp. TaxID=2898801 RepID=UPI0025DD75C0|nr:hypothetical protein [Seleniivibrio sp.]MCD8554751.1 hypothetical protein [Seleniivibrio sp.]